MAALENYYKNQNNQAQARRGETKDLQNLFAMPINFIQFLKFVYRPFIFPIHTNH